MSDDEVGSHSYVVIPCHWVEPHVPRKRLWYLRLDDCVAVGGSREICTAVDAIELYARQILQARRAANSRERNTIERCIDTELRDPCINGRVTLHENRADKALGRTRGSRIRQRMSKAEVELNVLTNRVQIRPPASICVYFRIRILHQYGYRSTRPGVDT